LLLFSSAEARSSELKKKEKFEETRDHASAVGCRRVPGGSGMLGACRPAWRFEKFLNFDKARAAAF
jgi:hypothetical protein